MESYSQYSDFTYWKELCDCKAKFDSTKYSREQLQNTFDYLWWSPNIDTDATSWTIEKIKELSLTDLENECTERINILKSFEFVEDSFWTQQKENLIIYYESTCRLKKYTILAYSNPEILLQYDLVDDKCI
ncbi:hypothetical protein [Mariniphaga sediminis]|nr:hypothetical protein [Mariniphaga sediminis]